MLAAFGMGHLELLMLGMLCLMMVGLPTIVIVVGWWLLKSWGRGRPLARPCPSCGMLAPEHGFCPHCGVPVDPA